MHEITILKQRISGIAHDAREQGQAEIADRLDDALNEFRKNKNRSQRLQREETKRLYSELRARVTAAAMGSIEGTEGTDVTDVTSPKNSKENVKRDIPPKPPIERNPKENSLDTNAGAREGDSAKNPKKSNNPDKPKEPEKRFVKPTLQEVAAYVAEKKYAIDPEAFWNFYESKGWKVGRTQMKSWKSACVTWQKRYEDSNAQAAERQAHIDAKMDERYEKRFAPRNEQDEADKAALARVEKARQESIELIRRLHNVH